MNRLSQLNDEQVWALKVREIYNWQLEAGSDEPALYESLLMSTPSGSALIELGRLGLVTACYRDGVYIEPASQYPRRGETELLTPRKRVA